MENTTRKDLYNLSPIDMRTHVKIGDDDEIAMKPYYYFRNRKLHIRYNVDRCIELSESESARLKVTLASTFDKQGALAKEWNFFITCVGKEIIRDGIAEVEKSIREYNEHGRKN